MSGISHPTEHASLARRCNGQSHSSAYKQSPPLARGTTDVSQWVGSGVLQRPALNQPVAWRSAAGSTTTLAPTLARSARAITVALAVRMQPAGARLPAVACR